MFFSVQTSSYRKTGLVIITSSRTTVKLFQSIVKRAWCRAKKIGWG
ncbi:unnamed protein product [Thlaspi arvense]|uniref:Uncharacterized protein n=1 Tax=Thlaspi arvense TaxID=13288 RepID=A0AAU9SHF8_THLAR|nr:unnamed protein product [Thlaspi arvense]